MVKKSEAEPSELVVDAAGHIAGRLSSRIAKELLSGKRVVVVNADKALLSGRRSEIMGEWMSKLEISSVVNPAYGPYHPRSPDRLLARMIRGMTPRRKPSGLQALRRLDVHIGVPREYAKREKMSFEYSKAAKPTQFYTTLGDVAREIGWKGG